MRDIEPFTYILATAGSQGDTEMVVYVILLVSQLPAADALNFFLLFRTAWIQSQPT
jgi:hypothetical protein